MNSTPAISIVVPVYKAEKFLHRCIDSILAQTMTKFELLLIDDGSPDNSGKICDEYAARDNRVRVIHKENEGVSSARQRGIDNVQGEYTIHVDSDDCIEPNMLEELYKKAKEDDADMVICDYYESNNQGTLYKKQSPKGFQPYQVIYDLFQQLHGSCWNKLIKSVCYKEHDIQFPKGINIAEDKIFIVQTCYFMHKIAYLNKAFYHYDRTNETSITHTHTLSPMMSNEGYNIMVQFYAKNNICDNLLLNGLLLFRITTLSSIALYGGKENKIIKYEKYIHILPHIHKHKSLAWSHKLALYFRILRLGFLIPLMLYYRELKMKS